MNIKEYLEKELEKAKYEMEHTSFPVSLSWAGQVDAFNHALNFIKNKDKK